jgi:DNA-3-methyladenine glycosylase
MFLPGGFIYIYLIYGMYYCFNIVTGNKEEPEAVLIRAIEPVKGIKLMKKNRNFNNLNRTNTVNLSNGPGKLCQAMGFTLKENGIDICKSRKIFIKDSPFISEKLIEYTTRKNIDYAGKAKDFPWRVILKNSKYVSK